MITKDDVIEIAVLKKHAKYFVNFARSNNIPIYKVNSKNDGIELAKAALKSPVLEKITEGLFNLYNGNTKEEDYIDVDSTDVGTEESEEFDLPPNKDKGEKDDKKEEE